MEFIKSIVKIIFMVFFTLFTSLTSLFIVKDDIHVNNQEFKYGSEFISEIGPEIIRCLKETDKQTLNSLFCEKVKNTKYLKEKIDYLFGYIEKMGGLYIDDSGKWNPAGGGHGSRNFYERTVEYEGYEYDKTIKIGDFEYNLDVSFYLVNKNHKEYEGVTRIFLWSSRDYNVSHSNSVINNSSDNKDFYLGFDIINYNSETFKWDSIVPSEINENEEYIVSFKELEKGARNW